LFLKYVDRIGAAGNLKEVRVIDMLWKGRILPKTRESVIAIESLLKKQIGWLDAYESCWPEDLLPLDEHELWGFESWMESRQELEVFESY